MQNTQEEKRIIAAYMVRNITTLCTCADWRSRDMCRI